MRHPTHLLVRAQGSALVQDLEALDAQIRRYVGRVLVDGGEGLAAFAPKTEATRVPNRTEYVRAIKDGDLACADEDTARFVFGDVAWREHFDASAPPSAEEKV